MEFKTIKSHPDFEIAKDGTIRRISSGRVMSKYKATTGYLAMRFYSSSHVYKDVYLHILLGRAFIPNDDLLKDCINHKDGNKMNNTLNNIEWCTKAYNLDHALKTGLRKSAKGERAGRSKLTNEMVYEIRKLIIKGESYKDISLKFNVSDRSICAINLKQTWSHI